MKILTAIFLVIVNCIVIYTGSKVEVDEFGVIFIIGTSCALSSFSVWVWFEIFGK